MPRSKVKDGFNRRWFMHPQWKDANQACILATGMGLYDAWGLRNGCTNHKAEGWMTYGKVAEVIISLTIEDEVTA